MTRRISSVERRARLVARHRLDRSAPSVAEAVHAVVAMHSSDPLTPHLGAWARVPGYAREDLEEALCEQRSVVRMHAMRRTLFVVPAEAVPQYVAGAARPIAAKERKRVAGWLGAAIDGDPEPVLVRARAAILDALADGPKHSKELSAGIEDLRIQMLVGSGKWARPAPLGSRLLYVLAMQGDIVRGRTSGSWRTSQYAWSRADAVAAVDPAAAREDIVRRYLGSHGPVTMTDLRWWTGWTVAQLKRTLVDVEEVALDEGSGFVLVGDVDGGEAAPSAALLPGLDSAPMGWKERGWFLGEHGPALFDRNGNVGPTVWWGGRIVGGWAARSDGVVFELLEDVGSEAASAIRADADALTAWLDGDVPIPRFRTPLEKRLTT